VICSAGHVRSAPESGRQSHAPACLTWAKLGLLRRNKQRHFHGALVPGEGAANRIKRRHTEAMRGYANNEQESAGEVLVSFKRGSRGAQDSNRSNHQQPEWKYPQARNGLQSKSGQ